MAYIQGTMIRVSATVTDAITHQPEDPADLILTIKQPDNTIEERTWQLGQITRLAVGEFYAMIDTSPRSGVWAYQFATTGTNAVVARAELSVSPSLPT